MSVFSGKQGKGAMRAHRADKVREANERDAKSRHHSHGRRLTFAELDPRIYEQDGTRRYKVGA